MLIRWKKLFGPLQVRSSHWKSNETATHKHNNTGASKGLETLGDSTRVLLLMGYCTPAHLFVFMCLVWSFGLFHIVTLETLIETDHLLHYIIYLW